jgi:hypothetical protein
LQWIRAQPPTKKGCAAGDQRPVLTASDVGAGKPASGTMSTAEPAEIVEIELGDVLIPAIRSDRTGGRNVRVAGPTDVRAIRGAHLHTLRVDRERLDPWFVAGFLSGSDNIAATRMSTVRFDPSRLRIPVVSLPEQQRYGALFQRVTGCCSFTRVSPPRGLPKRPRISLIRCSPDSPRVSLFRPTTPRTRASNAEFAEPSVPNRRCYRFADVSSDRAEAST